MDTLQQMDQLVLRGGADDVVKHDVFDSPCNTSHTPHTQCTHMCTYLIHV